MAIEDRMGWMMFQIPGRVTCFQDLFRMKGMKYVDRLNWNPATSFVTIHNLIADRRGLIFAVCASIPTLDFDSGFFFPQGMLQQPGRLSTISLCRDTARFAAITVAAKYLEDYFWEIDRTSTTNFPKIIF